MTTRWWRWVTWWIVSTTIFFVPSTTDSFYQPKASIGVIGALMLLSTPTLSFRSLANPWVRRLAWWVIIQFSFLVLLHPAFRQPILGVPFSPWAILPTLLFLTSLWMLEKLVRSTDTEARWVTVADRLCLLGVVVAGLGWVQWCGIDQIARVNPEFNTGRASSFFGNTMVHMGYLATVLPLYLLFKPLRYRIGFGFIGGLLLVSGSAIGVVAGLVGLGTLWGLSRRWRLLGLLTVLSVGALIVLQYTAPSFLSITDRPIIWLHLLAVWKSVPFTGIGLGGVAHQFGFKQQVDLQMPFNQAHNDYLQALVELGLIGVLLAGLAVGWCVWKTMRRPRTILQSGWLSVLAALSIVMAFSFPLQIAPCMMVGLLAWAGLESQVAEGG